MSREEYKKAISDAVNTSPKNKKKKKDYEYAKNAPNNYDIINQYGNQNAAIRWAKACTTNLKTKGSIHIIRVHLYIN